MLNSLSGRFLVLTTVFVVLAEVLILVPSVARYREDYLLLRLERAQIASLALLAAEALDEELEDELLRTAGIYNVVLRRDEMRQLVLDSPVPTPISDTFDLRDPGPIELIIDAVACLVDPSERVIRVIGNPVREAGLLIEVTMPAQPLREAMLAYGLRVLLLSAVISILTALLLFIAVRRVLVKPIKGVIDAMTRYADAPEDARRIIKPEASLTELREAEVALQSLQTQLTGALRQKERLAQLGAAVAKVSHDLRNILTSTQLLADRIETSADPAMRRMAPKLLGSISRAVALCETTLAFGKAEEPPPMLNRIALSQVVEDVLESERLAAGEEPVTLVNEVPAGLVLRADTDQIYRVLANLVRNARQAIQTARRPGEIRITASETESEWAIDVEDNGPGLPPKAQEHLFAAFSGGARKGGTGLGLAIAAELVRGHGGRLSLARTGKTGTTFTIRLPKGTLILGTAAE
ncbi:sensor histidine kinase [Roseitranquillus sediminis]|uniref:sensor histidine kinase n=1 Tax=Roseitranquillus sediminis TaxID=2809051 RepID=UPI001D0C5FD2|nr:HAMP domain-containing sensor histidine kinase [Roseitranquillus sediminis]MBM9596443.1 HAMP domain-containing histidine kinase [Roseitranquillus sediminis]